MYMHEANIGIVKMWGLFEPLYIFEPHSRERKSESRSLKRKCVSSHLVIKQLFLFLSFQLLRK